MQREITRELVRRLLPGRMAESNKGSYGSVLAAAGSMAYRGAAALCTEGALRGGAGLVYLASVEPVIQLVLSRTPECCACGCRTAANGGIHPQDADALRRWFADRHAVLLAGPGLGESAADVCKALLGRNAPWVGAVLDADGLNAAASLLNAGRALPHPAGELILTPHPGEMSRLTGLSASALAADREDAACRFAREWNAVVVLKGAGTVVAAPDGRCRVNTTGNPGLSRGGSGDVLAGMTAALLACGLPAFEAAACAVYLHGAAADRAAALHGEIGMLPHDLLDALGTLFAENGR